MTENGFTLTMVININPSLQITANCGILFEPFLPFSSTKIMKMMNLGEAKWADAGNVDIMKEGNKIGQAELMFRKIEDAEVDAQIAKLDATKKAIIDAAKETKAIVTAEEHSIYGYLFMKYFFRLFSVINARGQRLSNADLIKSSNIEQLRNCTEWEINQEAIAKANNMDPAILNRLDQLEAINAEYTRNKLAQEVEGSLLNIQSKYGASEGDLEAFVNELLEEGYDVSKSGSNLELEFLRRNFDKIKAREIDNAVRAEQERSAKASGASKPANKQGQEDNTTEHEINTVEDLNNFFNETMK